MMMFILLGFGLLLILVSIGLALFREKEGNLPGYLALTGYVLSVASYAVLFVMHQF